MTTAHASNSEIKPEHYDILTEGDWENGQHPCNPKWNSVKPICWPQHSGITPECEGGRVYFKNPADAKAIGDLKKILAAWKATEERCTAFQDERDDALRELAAAQNKAAEFARDVERLRGVLVRTQSHATEAMLGEESEDEALATIEGIAKEALSPQATEGRTASADGEEVTDG